ncbi:hypothetical protein OUZ56_005076 [Daphnia magna]|uniref:Uncharacterized protein n=1 Tax=Daphnia magna TaxID=35525 RepID=A0ABQ9YRT2_9CRUS|nr:hypothetical protein OUZ56_005076 [Daphnia magna]
MTGCNQFVSASEDITPERAPHCEDRLVNFPFDLSYVTSPGAKKEKKGNDVIALLVNCFVDVVVPCRIHNKNDKGVAPQSRRTCSPAIRHTPFSAIPQSTPGKRK